MGNLEILPTAKNFIGLALDAGHPRQFYCLVPDKF